MSGSEENECIDVIVPQNAVEVEVTNIINPFHIRIHEVTDDHMKKDEICRKLQNILKIQMEKTALSNYRPTVQDWVIVSNNRIEDNQVDLPHWICRGFVTDTASQTTDVFLIDYGVTVNVPTNSPVKYSYESIPIDPLTLTVGLYNILPVNSKLCLQKEWPENTISFMKELIQASKKIYFQVLACDRKKDKKYGDLYLVIEDQNISLSKVLLYCFLAVPYCKEIVTATNNNTGDKISITYQLKQGKSLNNKSSPKLQNNRSHVEKKKNTVSPKKQFNGEKMLILSELTCEPLKHIADARFTSVIHKALENQGVRSMKQIQSYMWPGIKKGLDVVAISPKASGKTVGYLVPIISCISAQEKVILEMQKNNVTKPLVLILCASVNESINITDKCKNILYNYDSIKTFAAFNGLTDKTLMTSICNKFHILVTTPPFLLRLLGKFSSKLNFSDLSCLILDHADDILDNYLSDLTSLIQKYKIIDKSRKNLLHGGQMQIVIASKTWTDKLDLFVNKFVNKPFICIGSFVEAAAYCKVQGRMLIRHSNTKKHEVLNILEDHDKIKTMIICINSEEAIELNNFLMSKLIKTALVHENMTITQVQEIRDEWMKCLSGMYPVIICTDLILHQLEVSNIEFLIHYTITNVSKTQFNRRFSVFMDNWILELKNKCKVMILFDETKENTHFKGVVDILKRLKVELPKDWKEIADGLDLANDIKKKNYPICESIKSFGTCKETSCNYRHRVIAEVDTPTMDIRIGDELKLHVIYVNSASHFAARILESTRRCNKTGRKEVIKFDFNILQLYSYMNKFYSKSSNKVLERDITVGKICAIRIIENYSRVQILNILEKDVNEEKPKIVRVRCIDDGKLYERVYVHDLYEIPPELLEYNLPVVDIYLSSIAPFDEEYKWTDIASREAQLWFKNSCSATSFTYAKVLLQIGNSIWTDNIFARSKLIGYADLVTSSLKEVILSHEYGTTNNDHLKKLIHLCYIGGLTEINGQSIVLPEHEDKNASIDECD